jgi:hypothetical protein
MTVYTIIVLAEKTSYEYAVSKIQYEVLIGKTFEENQNVTIKCELRLNADKNIVYSVRSNQLFDQFFWVPLFLHL